MGLIDADEALKALGEAPLVWDEYTDEYELGRRKQWEQDVEAIKAQPTIEAELVRRGRWIAKAYPWDACSCCGTYVNGYDCWKYCPCCGAKMVD